MFQLSTTPKDLKIRRSLHRSLRGPVWCAAIVLLLFFGAGGAWSILVPLASAAIAPGQISPEGHRKSIQHLEGGIVREIRAKDGEWVSKGDVLIVLEDAQAMAAFRVQETRLVTLRALEARLMAVENGSFEPDWGFVPNAPDREVAIADQQSILQAKLEMDETEREILKQRVRQLEEEIVGLNAQIESDTRQLSLVTQETDMVRKLTQKGIAPVTDLLALQRSSAEIVGRRAGNRAAVARAEQSIGETKLQVFALERRRLDEAATQLGDVRAQIADLEERMIGAQDILTRTVIRAPDSGRVFDLKVKNLGAVILPGEVIMDIVPLEEELMVDARVTPTDIDVVREGLGAEVALSAFAQRSMTKLKGTVRKISADRLTDENTGEEYYLARIEIDKAELGALGGDYDLVPGMPAEAMIFTGTRTFWNYLSEPLLASIDRSFVED